MKICIAVKETSSSFAVRLKAKWFLYLYGVIHVCHDDTGHMT